MKIIENNKYTLQYEFKKRTAKINYIGVKKRFRKNGIGKKAILDFIELCRKKEIVEIYIDAYKNSVPFWDKLGFQINHEPQIISGVVQDYHDGILKL